jgi:hypothetical protein
MVSYRKAGALVLALATVGVVHATQSLKVTLAEPADAPADQTGKIQVTLTNDGDEPVDVLSEYTPWTRGPKNGIASSIFDVRDYRGRTVTYWGELAKYVGFTYDDFIHLAPGQSISKVVDLAPIYRLKTGSYTVVYALDYSMRRPEPGKKAEESSSSDPNYQRRHAVSNTLQIQVNGSLLPAEPTASLSR